ncbi:S41 family peptidase [Qingrenia yutianensis]|uniref:S41 family peptidase n=1 Tax=Qingrenia yutianensis TaxID=2763676 RepID=A0A926F5H2_9FIRM|nr:S41 family peptidase [Qingrenia yutianensis]MBC8596118.1 S41 family peptidase [Qingrenia yutianensis]
MTNKQKTVYTVLITAVLTFISSTVLYFALGSNIVYFLSNNQTADGIAKLNRIDKLVDKYFYGDIDKKEMQDWAYAGYLAGLDDPYTEYISSGEYDSFTETSTGNYTGIGVEVTKNGEETVISDIFEGTPAEKAGFLPNDIIKKIDGKDMAGKALSEVSSAIKEYAGKTFAVTVERGGKMIDINVEPGEIETVQVSGKMLDGGISYIRISMFEGHCAEQLKTALDNAKNSGAKGIIFDVRNNPGGALDIITNCVDQILDEGIILTVRDKNGKENVYKAKDKEKIDLPIVILTNAQTASAAEVFTSSLHDNGKAYTVGTKTYGKGVVQTIFDLGDKSIAKITTAKYFTPKNVCIDKIGLEPDKKVELDEKYKKMSVKYIPDGEDAQLITAVEVMKEKIK